MGSPSIPAQPAAPDYAAANREGVLTDIENLPIRRQIDAAARLGQRVEYTDPRTGATRVADFTGSGDQAYAQQMADLSGQTNARVQRDQLALRRELGVDNARQTAAEIRAADPAGSALRDRLQTRVDADLNLGPANVGASGNIASAENRLWNMANSAPNADGRLGDLYDAAGKLPGEAKDSSTAALNEGLQKAVADFRLGGKLDESTKRDLFNDVRSGQAARGNYLGDAAAVVEATETGKAGDARAQQRLSNLLDIQNRAFGQNTQLRGETTQNAFNSLDRRAGLVGQDFGQRQQSYQTGLGAAQAAFQGTQAMAADQRSARQEGFAYDQQRLANAQQVGLGAPITNQFGSLGGAQQGSVAYNPVNFQGGQNTNAGAGAQAAQFAQGNYGTQAQMWGTSADIASKGSPWMSLLGSAAGAAAGMMI